MVSSTIFHDYYVKGYEAGNLICFKCGLVISIKYRCNIFSTIFTCWYNVFSGAKEVYFFSLGRHWRHVSEMVTCTNAYHIGMKSRISDGVASLSSIITCHTKIYGTIVLHIVSDYPTRSTTFCTKTKMRGHFRLLHDMTSLVLSQSYHTKIPTIECILTCGIKWAFTEKSVNISLKYILELFTTDYADCELGWQLPADARSILLSAKRFMARLSPGGLSYCPIDILTIWTSSSVPLSVSMCSSALTRSLMSPHCAPTGCTWKDQHLYWSNGAGI